MGPLDRRKEERMRAGRGYFPFFGGQIGREGKRGPENRELGGRGRMHADQENFEQMGRRPRWEDRDRREERAGFGGNGMWQQEEGRNRLEPGEQRRETPWEYVRGRRYRDESKKWNMTAEQEKGGEGDRKDCKEKAWGTRREEMHGGHGERRLGSKKKMGRCKNEGKDLPKTSRSERR
jgi:hypothetical protein